MSSEGVPTQDLIAEEHVIGSMLISPRAVEEAGELVTAPDFYRESHGLIFTAALELHAAGVSVDPVTLSDDLDKRGQLNKIGGQARIAELAALVPAASNVGHYARIVRETAVLRRLKDAGMNISRLATERQGELEVILARAEEELTKATALTDTSRVSPMTEGLDDLLNGIRDAYASGTPIFGMRVGFPDIDKTLLGLWEGQLVLLAARPGMGKSTLALNIAENVVDSEGPVLFVSEEMSKFELTIRSLARAAGVDGRRLKTGILEPHHAEQLGKAIPEVKARTGLFIEDQGGMTIPRLRAIAARLKRQENLKLIVVDYIQLMTGVGETRNDQVGSISRGLKQLARQLDVPILALSQMSRAIETRTEKRPTLSDLRDSGSLEQDADVVMFLHDDSVYDPDLDTSGTVEVIVAKNRNGAQDEVKLLFTKRLSKFVTPTVGPPQTERQAA